MRLKDGSLKLCLSRAEGSLGALPPWLAPLKCNGGHTGVYRTLVLDMSGSSLACIVKVLAAPPGATHGSATMAALCAQQARCIAMVAVEAGSRAALPMPFGKYYVKFLAGPHGASAGELQAACSSAAGKAGVLAAGGFVDYVRDFDAATGRGSECATLCNLEGEVLPARMSLKCGGGQCVLSTVGAAMYTELTVALTGKRHSSHEFAF